MDDGRCRCSWVKLNNPIDVKYHDEEWGVPLHDDRALYELLILETFQAGLSWETILNKRENFRRAYEGFIPERVAAFDAPKVEALMQDAGIVRNRRKIEASIVNSRIFLEIAAAFGSFDRYIWGFTDGKSIRESCELRTTSPLSDMIAKDLKKRGMKFVGSTCIYSTLQAIGVLAAHTDACDWSKL
ncbi:DNA-3-methyladenine glycosylase I [Selenomonas sp. F0473]|uniref:DNA-3-methyladenine glycosylase I n=1 Tax=Selenomonas sp. F0473 TaxID=999423 RepID=UPI00029EAD82|nr:DNA-3-methyladenine glycosylase I [Selenomonas sp. F0473]EKU70436.1 DNA-3-methyladenine glycosylase I [Selenomonas sp. F0473]